MAINLDKFKKRGPSELVALDFASTSLKAVRIKSTKDGLVVLAADILPRVEIEGDQNFRAHPLELPKKLRANYAAAAVSTAKAAAKMLNLPQQSGQSDSGDQLREQFGADTDLRLESVAVGPARGRSSNRRMLAAALPEIAIKNLLAMTAAGPPALRSCEVSALCALTAFDNADSSDEDSTKCFIEIGASSTYIFFIKHATLLLLRKYDVGSQLIIDRIVNDFHVDQKTAVNIMTEGAIDLSSVYTDELGFLARQAAISRDFVERQENCKVAKAVLSGGLACSDDWTAMLRGDIGITVETLDPFAGLEIAPNALDKDMEAFKPRFSAAIGAGIGGLQTA